MPNIKKVVFSVIMIFLFIVMESIISSAEEGNQGFGFTVEPILPENQLDHSVPFFYLEVKPSQSQEVQVRIKNIQDVPLEIDVTIEDAVTGNNGQINYNPVDPVYDKTLKQPLTSFVSMMGESNRISLTRYEEKIVTFKVDTPDNRFEGIKLGALSFKKVEPENKQGITNIKGYNIGMILTEDKSPYNQGGEISLNKLTIGLTDGYKTIRANFQNPKAKLISDLEINVTIKDRQTKKVIKTYQKGDMSMAPNSNFTFSIPWDMAPVKATTYIVDIKASTAYDSWEWIEELKVSKQTATKLNKKGLNKYSIDRNTMIAVYIVIILNIVVFIMKLMQLRNNKIENKLNKEGSLSLLDEE